MIIDSLLWILYYMFKYNEAKKTQKMRRGKSKQKHCYKHFQPFIKYNNNLTEGRKRWNQEEKEAHINRTHTQDGRFKPICLNVSGLNQNYSI